MSIQGSVHIVHNHPKNERTVSDLIKANYSIATTRQLAQGLVKRVEAPTVPYSQAMGQNLRRLWHAHFPDVSLF